MCSAVAGGSSPANGVVMATSLPNTAETEDEDDNDDDDDDDGGTDAEAAAAEDTRSPSPSYPEHVKQAYVFTAVLF